MQFLSGNDVKALKSIVVIKPLPKLILNNHLKVMSHKDPTAEIRRKLLAIF